MKKQIRKLFLVFVFLIATIFLFGFSSCDTTDPPPPTKSPRDYTWSVDTLGLPNTFQTLMLSIWGSSENDVYTCGHVSGSLGDLWHYDGKTWTVIDYFEKIGTRGSLQAVHGISNDNVWVVGYKPWQDIHFNKIEIPYVIQYDGIRWKKHEIDTEYGVYGVYVVSEFETWACGDGGIVYHYKNHKWELDTIKVAMTENDFFIIYSVAPFNGEIYAMGTNRESGSFHTQFYSFVKRNGDWVELAKFEVNATTVGSDYPFGSRLQVVSSDKLLSYGSGGIYLWKNNKWERIKDTRYAVNIYAQGENNIIAAGDFGIKYHYDGSDWQELNKFDIADIVYSGVWANKSDAFIVGFKGIGNAQKTLVLHGK